MDPISKYRQIIAKNIDNYAKLRYAHGEVERKTVFDREQNHYLLMIMGVEGHKMVHGCIVHMEIIEDKIWIHRDGTEDGVAGELLAEGVSQDKIVLGFYTPEKRKITDFAVLNLEAIAFPHKGRSPLRHQTRNRVSANILG